SSSPSDARKRQLIQNLSPSSERASREPHCAQVVIDSAIGLLFMYPVIRCWSWSRRFHFFLRCDCFVVRGRVRALKSADLSPHSIIASARSCGFRQNLAKIMQLFVHFLWRRDRASNFATYNFPITQA